MKYTGKLGKPIVRRRIGLLEPMTAYEDDANRIASEMFAKLPDLFAAHDIQDGDWVALSVALAKAHVPGFKVCAPVGRNPTWTLASRAELRADVDTLIQQSAGALAVTDAVRLAVESEPWKSKAKRISAASVEKQYYLADPRFVEIVKKARAYESMALGN